MFFLIAVVVTHIDHYTELQITDNERTRSHMPCKIVVQEFDQWTVLQCTTAIDLNLLLSSVGYIGCDYRRNCRDIYTIGYYVLV